MNLTPSIPSGNRFSNWWRLIWDRCTIHPDIQFLAKTKFTPLVHPNIKKETITWKLKYLTITAIHFTKIDISVTTEYLEWLIVVMRLASQFPIQLTYYQVILELFNVHRVTNYLHLLNTMRTKLVKILDVDIIDPILHLTDVDQYSRTILNNINRQSEQLIIYSIQCAQANLMYRKLLTPLKNDQLWIDFNLIAETITIICKRSCLRTERPSTDSEEFDDCTTEILTIEFDNVVKITVKNWGHKDNLQGKLLSFVLNNTPSYMYDSSRTAVELGTKLFLNIEQGDDLNRLLVILPERFTTRFEMLKYKPERKVSQPNTSQSIQSNMSLAHYSGRPVPVSSASLTRSGSTIKSICQVETTIQYVNTDNLSANNGGHVSNQNLKTHHLSLTTKDDVEDDSVIESSQENKPSTISSLQEKINRTMDKFNPEPYNHALDSMYKQRFNSSYKENQPVNTSKHHPSSTKNVMNKSMPKLSRNQLEIVPNMISLPSHSRNEHLFNVNKSSDTGPTQVNDRLKDILVESEYDNESVISVSDA
ncbi:hypothetical protein CBL_21268, partial [Carabus blaptoides fortunei]